MRGHIITNTNQQIPVYDDFFDRLIQEGGSARRVYTNGPGESWFVEQKGQKPLIIVVNSHSEASETLATMKEK